MPIKTYPKLNTKIEALLAEIQRQKEYIQRAERALPSKTTAGRTGGSLAPQKLRAGRKTLTLAWASD
jgi:hypothetical protein